MCRTVQDDLEEEAPLHRLPPPSAVKLSGFVVRKYQSSEKEERLSSRAALRSHVASMRTALSPWENVRRRRSFRLLHKLQGDDAAPSKKNETNKKTALRTPRTIFRFIYVSLSFYTVLSSSETHHCLSEYI